MFGVESELESAIPAESAAQQAKPGRHTVTLGGSSVVGVRVVISALTGLSGSS